MAPRLLGTIGAVATRALAVLAAVSLPACGGCGGDDDGGGPSGPRTEIVDPGSGEPNAAPLWPLTPGVVLGGPPPTLPVYVTGPIELDGVSMLRIVRDGRPSGYSEPNPNEPAFVKYVSVGPEGVLFHGMLREGLFAAPVLLIPREVRLGMRWISRTDGDEPRFVFEVTRREHAATLFGEGTTWTIAIDDRALTQQVAAPEGADYEVTYLEGRGPIDGLPFSMGGGVTPALAIVPLEPPPLPAPPARPVIALERMYDGAPVIEETMIHRVSFIEDAASYGAGALMTAYGLGAGLGASDPEGGVAYQDETAVACTIVRDAGLALPPGDGCSEAGGVSLAADGARSQIITDVLGRTYPPDVPCGPGDDCSFLSMRAIYHDGDQARVVVGGGVGESLFGRVDPAKVRDNVLLDGLLRTKGVFRTLPFTEDLWLAAALDDGVALGVPLPGALGFGRVGADGVATMGHPALALDGPLSVSARPGERVWLATTADGLIDRVHLTAAGVEVEPLGRVELPPGAYLAGATLDGDQLIAAIQEGFLGYDPQVDPDTGERDGRIAPDFGDLFLWRGTVAATGTRIAPPPMITATPVSRDVKVCWTAGLGAPDLDPSHWSLGQGLQPMAVVPAGDEGRCVLLVRQLVQIDVDAPGQWAIEGPIPGLGRVAIAIDPIDQFDRGVELATEWPEDLRVAPFLAPLEGGGLVTDSFLYGPGATIVGGHGELIAAYNPTIDLAGAGLWHPLPGASPPRVMLQGRTRQIFELPGAEEAFVGRPTFFGSGVVVGHGSTTDGVLTPDGTLTPLPDVSDLTILWVTADATVCGVLLADGTAFRCRDASGAQVASGSWSGDQVLGHGPDGRIYGLDVAGARLSIYTLQGGGLSQQQVTLDQYGLTAATGFVQAPDGKAYLFQQFSPPVQGGDYRHVLVDLDQATTSTSNQLASLDLSAYLISKVPIRVVAEEDLLTIFPDGAILGLPRVIRLPRP